MADCHDFGYKTFDGNLCEVVQVEEFLYLRLQHFHCLLVDLNSIRLFVGAYLREDFEERGLMREGRRGSTMGSGSGYRLTGKLGK